MSSPTSYEIGIRRTLNRKTVYDVSTIFWNVLIDYLFNSFSQNCVWENFADTTRIVVVVVNSPTKKYNHFKNYALLSEQSSKFMRISEERQYEQ